LKASDGFELAGPDGKRYFTNEGICISSVLRDAVTALGLTDPLYDLAFGEVRPVLVKLIERADPPTTADAVLPTLIRTHPSFSFAFDQWTQLYGQPGQGADAALACAEVAVGAALRQWARGEGHEAISAAGAATPAPSAELRQLVSHYDGMSTVPSQVYREVLTALQGNLALVEPIRTLVPADKGALAGPWSFLVGVSVGGDAYDPPPGS
jgi:hypothetical protein